MKASATFFVFLAFFCGCQACEIESFNLNWLCVNGSASVLHANCCTSLYATLLFRVNNAVLNTSEELEERGITPVVSTGYCVNFTVDNLPENVDGSLAAQCNAERGPFDSTCDSQLQKIGSPPCSSTRTATMDNFTEQTATVENSTETASSENPETISNHVETNATHDATTDGNTQGDSTLTIVAAGVSSVICVSVITIACILLACCHYLKKRKSLDLSLEHNGDQTVAPKPTVSVPLQPTDIVPPEQVSDKSTPSQLVSRRQNPLPGTMYNRNDGSTINSPPPIQEDTLLPSFHADHEEGNLTQSNSSSVQCTDNKMKNCGSQVYVTHKSIFY